MPTTAKRKSSIRSKRPVPNISDSAGIQVSDPTQNTSFFSSPTKVLSLAVFLVLCFFFYKQVIVPKGGAGQDNLKTKVIPDAVQKLVNNPSTKITVNNLKEMSGVYQFELQLDSGSGNPQKYTSYISKDGKILFQSGIELANLNKNTADASSQTEQKKLTCDDLKKSNQTKLTAYVVSQCPYGLQMQRVFNKAISEQPQLGNNLDIKYIGAVVDGKITSMHGDQEAQENLRQICIREEQKDKYWPYVACYMKEGKTDDCLKTANINSVQLSSCTADANKGLKYAQADFDLQNKMKVSGSPTLLLNGEQIVSEFDFGGRIPNAVKELVCCSSSTKPDYCGKELSKESAAVAFSVNDTTTNTNNAANCGN